MSVLNIVFGIPYMNIVIWTHPSVKIFCSGSVIGWFGGIQLQLIFPLLFLRSSFPNTTVMEMSMFLENKWYWHFKGDFESLSELERDQEKELHKLLMNVGPEGGDINDTFIWFANVEGKYLVWEGYLASIKKINENMPNIDVAEAMASIWKSKVPSKVHVFHWRCLKDRITTKEKLFKREGVNSNDNDRLCSVCIVSC